MGNYLTHLLAESGIETVVTSRNIRISEKNIKYVKGNAHDNVFLNSLLEEDWDAIVDFMVYSTSEFKERYNLYLETTSQYIFLSSARVYANSNDPIIETSKRLLDTSDDTDFLSTDEYALSKARQEKYYHRIRQNKLDNNPALYYL